jgi:rhodanese-related sulfurtransferase
MEDAMNPVTRDQLKQVVDNHENVIIVDATSEKDFAMEHIPGAVSIPAGKVKELAPQLIKDKNQKIITYCGSTTCPASTRVAEGLEEMGYTDVNEYKPGKAGWREGGLPFEQSSGGAQVG